MKFQNDVGRACGACNACCKPMPVPEVGKHGSEWCPHCVIGTGCSIYLNRPIECRLFTCMWLNGVGNDSYRPDHLGVMMDCEDLQLPDREVGVLHLYEMREGALEQTEIRDLVEANKDAGFIIVFHRIDTGTTYTNEWSMRKHLFTDQEFEFLKTKGT